MSSRIVIEQGLTACGRKISDVEDGEIGDIC
jgi:hypothetical protein